MAALRLLKKPPVCSLLLRAHCGAAEHLRNDATSPPTTPPPTTTTDTQSPAHFHTVAYMGNVSLTVTVCLAAELKRVCGSTRAMRGAREKSRHRGKGRKCAREGAPTRVDESVRMCRRMYERV